MLLSLLLLGPAAFAADDLTCELTVLPENHAAQQSATFGVVLGKPAQGEFQGYSYYVTYQKTTRRAATFQLSHDDGFFIHGSSYQPEGEVSFSGLGYDGDSRNTIYLGCQNAAPARATAKKRP